jgi:hypothetical protein
MTDLVGKQLGKYRLMSAASSFNTTYAGRAILTHRIQPTQARSQRACTRASCA